MLRIPNDESVSYIIHSDAANERFDPRVLHIDICNIHMCTFVFSNKHQYLLKMTQSKFDFNGLHLHYLQTFKCGITLMMTTYS